MQFFARKIFYCGSLKTSLCCHLEGFDGSGCKGGEKVPQLSQRQGKFGLILYSLGYSSLGQITLLDWSFTWPKEKLFLSPQSVGTGMARGGFGGLGCFTDLHIPGFPWEGKASAACGGEESSGFLCRFFDLISCCCSVSLMVSGAWTDAVLLCRQKMEKLFVFSVAQSRCWQGPAPVLYSQSTAESQWCSSQAGGKGWGWRAAAWVRSPPKPYKPSRCFIALFPLTSCRQLLLRDPISLSLFLIQSLFVFLMF